MAAPPIPVPPRATRPLPGDALAYRFIDHTDEAEVSGDLAAAWRDPSLDAHPQRALRPYGLRGDGRDFRAVEMAFADADVADYADARPHTPLPVRAFDPVWNRTRAVYLSRTALYLPAGARQRYRVPIPARARLEAQVGLLGPPATLKIAVDGEVVHAGRIARASSWQPLAIDLARFAGRTVTIDLALDGPPGAHGFVADPIVWSLGGGAPGPNLIVIVVDTLRRDALAACPRLSAFAAKGARFDQAITGATWTRPSLLALYGGDLPSALGQSAEQMIPDDADRRRFYRAPPPLLPPILERAGWQASAIGNNFFLLAYPAIGLDMGFEQVDDIRHPVLDTPAITRGAIRFLEAHRERSFLLHLHYDAPHWPYTPPPEYLARVRGIGDAALQKDPLWAQYLAEAAYADDYVGRVLDALDRLKLAERTLVVVVGDHGEVFDPRHAETVEALGQPTLHHHGWSAWDEILRVPLIAVQPGAISPQTPTGQVRLYDLAPTALDYLGIEGAHLEGEAREGAGRSLRPILEGREKGDRVALAEGQDVRALRDQGTLYLERTDGRIARGGEKSMVDHELYDLAKDPAQHDDLSAKDPARLAKMAAELARLTPDGAKPARYHLVAAGQGDEVIYVKGTIRAEGRITVVERPSVGACRTIDSRTLEISALGCVFTVEPPIARLTFDLHRDGKPVPVDQILAGEFALPVLAGPPTLDGLRLSRLDAVRPPQIGFDGAVHLWREARSRGETQDAAGQRASDEVTGLMQRWGYAQPAAAPKGAAP